MLAPESSFNLTPVPPFSLELTVWALRRRPNNEVDRWDGITYSRIFAFGKKTVKVAVSQKGDPAQPKLHVTVSAEASGLQTMKSKVSAILEKMFSIKTDLGEFYSFSDGDKRLMILAGQFVGMKPPRFPTVFEALVNAISCQQISLDLGIILLNRLSISFGSVFKDRDSVLHAFPDPEDLAGLSIEDFRRLGFSRNKGAAIIELCLEIVNDRAAIESLEKFNDAEVVEYLIQFRGIGRWSAEYALLRGLGRLNIFPGDDVGAQRNLQSFLGLDERPGYEQIRRITSRWHPYAGFIYFHLLLAKLKSRGYIS